jgi:hypothetical protein
MENTMTNRGSQRAGKGRPKKPQAVRAAPQRAPSPPSVAPGTLEQAVVDPTAGALSPELMLALQATRGNQFVQRLIGSMTGGPPAVLLAAVEETTVVRKSAAELYKMTLTDFYEYAKAQIDWFNHPTVSAGKRRSLRTLLMFASRDGILAGCGPMKVAALLNAGVIRNRLTINEALAKPLQVYGQAVGRTVDSVEFDNPTTNISKAIKWGRALDRLMRTPSLGGAVLKRAMPQEKFEALVNGGHVTAFIRYCRTCSPRIEAQNGADIESYLEMKVRDGVDPVFFHSTSLRGQVRNYHRFQALALKQLIKNFNQADRPNAKRKPLTLILHSATDHNGAFHRDPFLTAVIRNPRILTLMIEGKETLADVAAELPGLAARYGKDGKVDQAMIAGHGNARVIELGAKEPIYLSDPTAAAKADKFFDELLRHMSNDPAVAPHRRIVFNACLTGSNEVRMPLDADPTKAAKQVRDQIKKESSLATYLQMRARAKGLTNIKVLGASGSFGQVKLIDAADGLTIISSADKALTSPKIDYVKKGKDAQGVLRAALECWAGVDAADPAKAQKDSLAAMTARAAAPATAWDDVIVKAMFQRIVAAHQKNGEMIRAFGGAAGALSHLAIKDDARVGTLTGAGMSPGKPLENEISHLFTPLSAAAAWSAKTFIPLVAYQVWMRKASGKRASFMSTLANFTCQTAAEFLDTSFIKPELPHLLPKTGTPSKAQLLLAFRAITDDPTSASAKAFLLRAVGKGNRRFPSSLNVGAILQGNPTEQDVLISIGLATSPTAPKAPTGPKKEKANLDVDGDGKNEVYVIPLPGALGRSTAAMKAYKYPDGSSDQLPKGLARGLKLYIVGESAGFYGVHYPYQARRVAFVEKANVKRIAK